MSYKIKLEVFQFRVKDNHGNYQQFGNILSREDFIDFFSQYVQSYDHTIQSDNQTSKTLELANDEVTFASEQGLIAGMVEGGQFGIGGRVKNLETGEQRATKSPNDSDQIPFYFLIYIPQEGQIGFLILQIYSSMSISSFFQKHFKRNFKSHFGYTADLQKYTNSGIVRKAIEDGYIKEVSLIRHFAPEDYAERFQVPDDYDEDHLKMQFVIEGTRGNMLGFFRNQILRQIENPNVRFLSLPDELQRLGFGDDHTDTFIKVEIQGRERKVELSDVEEFKPNFYVDDEIQKDQNNFPTFESIDEYAREFLQTLIREHNYEED